MSRKSYLGINTSKDHKTRGRLIELVIALSVGLLFSMGIIVILTMGNWLLWEEDAMGRFDGYVVDASIEEMDSIDSNFDTGRKYIFGYNDRNEVIAHDKGFYEEYDYILLEGKFPNEKDEVVLSQTSLTQNDVNIGDILSLEITRENETYTDTFTVVGVVKDSKYKDIERSLYLLSDEYRDGKDYWEEIYVQKVPLRGNIDSQLAKLGVESDRVRSMLGDGSMIAGLMIPTFAVVAAILLLSISAISSIFTYSINERVKTIGLLKAIGTTKKQLKVAHLKDGYYHLLRGYLLGIIVGLVGFFIIIYLPLLLRGDMSLNESLLSSIQVDIYKVRGVWVLFAFMFVIVGFLTFISVRISILIPFKKTNRLSIVQSIHYQSSESKRKSRKKSIIKNPSIRLSIIHFMSNKSKTVLPTMMLSMSVALFIFFASFLNSMDSRILAESNMDGDVVVEAELTYDEISILSEYGDEYGVFGTIPVEIDFDDILYLNEENYATLDYFKEFYEKAPTKLIALNDVSFKEYNIDPLEVDEVYLYDWRNRIEIPENNLITFYIDGKEVTYKVKDFIDTREIRISSTGVPMIIVNHEVLEGNIDYSKVFFSTDTPESLKKELLNFKADMKVTTIDEFEESLKKENSMITSLGMGLLSVVGLISLTMIINNVYTSVYSRKQEVAVLKSIGMTRVQLQRYFSIENYIYLGMTAIISIPIGYFLGKFVVEKLAEVNSHFGWHFQPLSLLVFIFVYLVIRFVTNKSLVQHEKNTIAELIKE